MHFGRFQAGHRILVACARQPEVSAGFASCGRNSALTPGDTAASHRVLRTGPANLAARIVGQASACHALEASCAAASVRKRGEEKGDILLFMTEKQNVPFF
jgi:hypothetical protein